MLLKKKDEDEVFAFAEDEKRRRRMGGVRAIVGGILIHFTLGSLYTWGNMTAYVTSYMRNVCGMTQYHNRDLGYVFSAIVSGQAIGMVTGGLIESAMGPRITVYFGGAVLAIGVCSSSFLLSSYVGFIITYGLLFGLGMGIAYTAPLACALRWIPHKKGLVSGLITAGLGASSLVVSLIQTSYINPDNLSPEPFGDNVNAYFTDVDLLNRVPKLVFFSSILYLTLIWLGGTLLVNPSSTIWAETDNGHGLPEPANILVDHSGIEVDARPSLYHAKNATTVTKQPQYDFTPMEALSQGRFMLLYLLFFLIAPAYTFVTSNWKIGPAAVELEDNYLSLVGSIASLCNGTGRILWGQLLDLLSPKLSLLMLSGLWSISLFALGLFGTYGAGIYTSCVVANFFCFGGNYALFPAFITIAFGRQYLGTIYGILYLSQLLGSNVSSFTTQRFTPVLGYAGMCYVYGCCILTVFILTLFFGSNLNKPVPPPNDRGNQSEKTRLL